MARARQAQGWEYTGEGQIYKNSIQGQTIYRQTFCAHAIVRRTVTLGGNGRFDSHHSDPLMVSAPVEVEELQQLPEELWAKEKYEVG